MKIAVLQAESQKEKNNLLYECTKKAAEKQGHEVINFGIYTDEDITFSYIQTALCACLLCESGAIDFIVTGCSSGQGMMLACNSLPGLICGYTRDASDAFLFGRINDGNAVSYPLGLGFGWSGELNLENTMEALFKEPFGTGYPKKDAERKQRDTLMMKEMNRVSKRNLREVLPLLEEELVKSVLDRKVVYNYILDHGSNHAIIDMLKRMKDSKR